MRERCGVLTLVDGRVVAVAAALTIVSLLAGEAARRRNGWWCNVALFVPA